MSKDKLLRLALFFLVFVVAMRLVGRKAENNSGPQEDVTITSSGSFVLGKNFQFTIQNHWKDPIELKTACPTTPVKIGRYDNGTWKEAAMAEDQKVVCKDDTLTIAPGASGMIDLTPWSLAFFSQNGRYHITVPLSDGRLFDHEFEVTPPSGFRSLFNMIFFKPIFNTLFLLIAFVPGKNFGLAIILLTLLIKLILLAPNQKALKSQKKMQELQPQLDALKLRYKNEPQQLAKETMELWKKYKVSPMGSCLPMLIQLPILIALFYAVQSDLSTVQSALFLYEPLKHMDWSSIQTNFFGLIELTEKNKIVLPVIVGLLQFFQMRLALGGKKTPAVTTSDAPNPGPMMNKMMIYAMPVMIAFFTATLPAATGFYWGASTLFGIVQQIFVNRSKD